MGCALDRVPAAARSRHLRSVCSTAHGRLRAFHAEVGPEGSRAAHVPGAKGAGRARPVLRVMAAGDGADQPRDGPGLQADDRLPQRIAPALTRLDSRGAAHKAAYNDKCHLYKVLQAAGPIVGNSPPNALKVSNKLLHGVHCSTEHTFVAAPAGSTYALWRCLSPRHLSAPRWQAVGILRHMHQPKAGGLRRRRSSQDSDADLGVIEELFWMRLMVLHPELGLVPAAARTAHGRNCSECMRTFQMCSIFKTCFSVNSFVDVQTTGRLTHVCASSTLPRKSTVLTAPPRVSTRR